MTDLSRIVLLTDLDGTLLPASKRLSETDLTTVQRFQAAGGRFAVATGRTLEATRPYLSQLLPSCPTILYNGAMIYDYATEKILHTTTLPPDAPAILRQLMAENPEMGVEILRADGTWVIRLNDYERRHIATCGVSPIYTTPEEMPTDGWLKILFAMAPEDVDRLEASARAASFPNLCFVRSADIFLEILPGGVSKGAALSAHRNLFAAKTDIVLAAGDYDNDLELLAAADCAVCPANAREMVKQAVNLVLSESCEEQAIPNLLERLIRGDPMGLSALSNDNP